MTDQSIPADKVQEIIDMMDTRPTHPDGTSRHSEGYNEAVCLWDKHLRALLPKPRTLADELREYGDSLAGVSVGDLRRQLILFADRVGTLEKERDEAQAGGRAAADNWTNTARRLEEAQAEITRLRGRDNDDELAPEPGHPTHLKTEEDYQNAPTGTIVQMEVPGWAHFIKDEEEYWATKGFIGYYTSESMSGTPCVVVEWGTAPVDTPEPERIDPKICGRYTWYLVEVDGEEHHGIRMDPGYSMPWVVILKSGRGSYASDEEVRVIRKLTCEEMDAQ